MIKRATYARDFALLLETYTQLLNTEFGSVGNTKWEKDSIEISIEKYSLEINDHSNFFFFFFCYNDYLRRKAYVLLKRT